MIDGNRHFDHVMPLTLVYIVKGGDEVLLIERRPGKVFADEWLGVGGKVEPHEDVIASAVRETLEETGLGILDPVLRGTIVILDETEVIRLVFILVATQFVGEVLREGSEGSLKWHRIDSLEQLDGLSRNQNLFIERILREEDYFYYGVIFLHEGCVIQHISSDTYFGLKKAVHGSGEAASEGARSTLMLP